MKTGSYGRVLVPIFYDYYFFNLLRPIVEELVSLGVPVTLMTWDRQVVEKYKQIDPLEIVKAPRLIRSFWNRANRPTFRLGLWLIAWAWVSALRHKYDCVILPFDNKPVWYVMSRLMRSVYNHSSTEFIDLELTLERERIRNVSTWQYRTFQFVEKILKVNLLPRLADETLKFFPHRLWVDRLMGWRAPNYLCGFSGVDLLTVAGSENASVYSQAGIDKSKIMIAGSPLYDRLWDIRKDFLDLEKERFKSGLGLKNNSKIFSFFLSPSAFSTLQIKEVETIVRALCEYFPAAQIVIKFHPKTRLEYVEIFRTVLRKHTQNLVLIHEFSGDEFNAQLILCSDYVVQKQSTVGYIAMRLGVPILSYNIEKTEYEDDMYKIIGASLHIENRQELEAVLPGLFSQDTLIEIKCRQKRACEKFCLDVDSASKAIARGIVNLVNASAPKNYDSPI